MPRRGQSQHDLVTVLPDMHRVWVVCQWRDLCVAPATGASTAPLLAGWGACRRGAVLCKVVAFCPTTRPALLTQVGCNQDQPRWWLLHIKEGGCRRCISPSALSSVCHNKTRRPPRQGGPACIMFCCMTEPVRWRRPRLSVQHACYMCGMAT